MILNRNILRTGFLRKREVLYIFIIQSINLIFLINKIAMYLYYVLCIYKSNRINSFIRKNLVSFDNLFLKILNVGSSQITLLNYVYHYLKYPFIWFI